MKTLDKNLLEELKAEYVRVAGKFPSYIKDSDIDFIVKLSDGSLYYETKPRIETDFPVGYSNAGQGITYDQANKKIDYIEKNESYFLEYNLENQFDSNHDFIFSGMYRAEKLSWGKARVFNITHIRHLCEYDFDAKKPLPLEDAQLLLAEFTQARTRFKKRLETYLKRYGLSKLRVWRYWIDE